MPESTDDFVTVYHGASYMGAPSKLPEFAFLLDHTERRPFSTMPVLATGDCRDDLTVLLDLLAAAGCEVIAVECTTDEARDVGCRVVRVLVPQLVPLSFTQRARYLAHPRLYSAPARMGYPVHPETGINPLPQPFA